MRSLSLAIEFVDQKSEYCDNSRSDRQSDQESLPATATLFSCFRVRGSDDPDFHGLHDLTRVVRVSHVFEVVSPVLTRMFQQNSDPTGMFVRVLRHLWGQRLSLTSSTFRTDVVNIPVYDEPQGLFVIMFGDFVRSEDPDVSGHGVTEWRHLLSCSRHPPAGPSVDPRQWLSISRTSGTSSRR